MSQWYKLPEDKRYPCHGKNCLHANVSTPENKLLSRELAAKSTVLLKNEKNLLPLRKPSLEEEGESMGESMGEGMGEGMGETTSLTIALIGLGASSSAYTAGTGSGGVQNSPQMVSPLDAFSAIKNINIIYVNGCVVVVYE